MNFGNFSFDFSKQDLLIAMHCSGGNKTEKTENRKVFYNTKFEAIDLHNEQTNVYLYIPSRDRSTMMICLKDPNNQQVLKIAIN